MTGEFDGWKCCADSKCARTIRELPPDEFKHDPEGLYCSVCFRRRNRHAECPCGECQRVIQMVLELEASLCTGGKMRLARKRKELTKLARRPYHREKGRERMQREKLQAIRGS